MEYVGNYFRNETKVDYSQRALEKACPLLDLLSVEDASGCLQSLDANYRLSETFPDDEAISLQTKKLLDPYQHLKIELWLKTFLQMRQEYNSNYEEVVLMFLKRFTGNEILHRISLISQNLFSELLVSHPF